MQGLEPGAFGGIKEGYYLDSTITESGPGFRRQALSGKLCNLFS